MRKEPLYTLRNRSIAKYFDYVLMYARINRLLLILAGVFLLVGVGYSIFLFTQPIATTSILVFVTVGIALVLMLLLIFLLPFLSRRANAKNLEKLEVRFFDDHLDAYAIGHEKEQSASIPYEEFTGIMETKTSWILLKGKSGLVFSKKDEYPEELVTKWREAVSPKK